MVDRYQSLVNDDEGTNIKPKTGSILKEKKDPKMNTLIAESQRSANQMKKCIKNYRGATTAGQQQEIVQNFKNQYQNLKNARTVLSKQYEEMKVGDDNPQKLLIKQHLLKAVQRELKLDVQMNQMISNKERQLQIETKTLKIGSERLKNAQNDLKEKRNQIIYLQEQVKQCMQLLQLIGILVLENTAKINEALDYVGKANVEIDNSLKIIDKAKINQSKCRTKMCCIIIIGIIVILAILFVVFKLQVWKN